MKVLIFILIPFLGFSQVYKIAEDRYSIDFLSLQKLDNFAKRYYQCDSSNSIIEQKIDSLEYFNSLLDAKSDSFAMKSYQLNKILINKDNQLVDLNNKLNIKSKELTVLKLKYNEKRKESLWYKITSGALAIGFIAFVAKSF